MFAMSRNDMLHPRYARIRPRVANPLGGDPGHLVFGRAVVALLVVFAVR